MRYILLGMIATTIFSIMLITVLGFHWWHYPIQWAVSLWLLKLSSAACDESLIYPET